MLKWIQKLLCICLVLISAGCGNRYGANIHTETSTTVGVSDVLEQGTAAAEESAAPETAAPEETPEAAPEETAEAVTYDTVELDLTVLSATLVYSEVYNMLTQPENYLGRTVKMAGQYTEHYNEVTNQTYFACIILDATACCAQGMEFRLTDAYSYPEDYPKEGDMICVAGIYDRYEEDGYPYYTLKDAVFIQEG